LSVRLARTIGSRAAVLHAEEVGALVGAPDLLSAVVAHLGFQSKYVTVAVPFANTILVADESRDSVRKALANDAVASKGFPVPAKDRGIEVGYIGRLAVSDGALPESLGSALASSVRPSGDV
jgi:hypothetical protein